MVESSYHRKDNTKGIGGIKELEGGRRINLNLSQTS